MTISGFWGFATITVIVVGFIYYTYMKYNK